MNREQKPHCEVFTSDHVTVREGRHIVYPPSPDADGKFALSEVLDWAIFMDSVYEGLARACGFLRSVIHPMSREEAGKIAECVSQMERILPIFRRRDLDLIPEQQRLKDVCAMYYCEAVVWADHEDSLQSLATCVAGSPAKWQSFSQALVENHLEGQKDWRHARTPVHWVKRATNNIAQKESWLTCNAIDRSNEPDVISLEEIAESPIEGLLERKYSYQSVADLEAAAKDDPETAEYLACKIHNPLWSCETISSHLQWDEKRGKRVDRRYRRLRQEFRDRGMGIACRDYRPPNGVSDANFTVHFEELFDGSRGRGVGVWQHRNPG